MDLKGLEPYLSEEFKQKVQDEILNADGGARLLMKEIGKLNHPLVRNVKREGCDVYVGRPTKWGNPFSHQNNTTAEFIVATREDAILEFEKWFKRQPELVEAAKKELRGKTLGCYCAPKSCHADVLLAAIANS